MIHPKEVVRQSVAEEIEARGWTLDEFTERMQFGYRASANDYLTYGRRMTLVFAMRLAQCFGTSVDYWLRLGGRVDLVGRL